jgi:hypothetical protein
MSLHDEPVVSSTPDSSMQSVCHTCVTGRRGKELDLTGRIYAADTTAPRHTTTAPMTAPMTAPTASTKASAMVPTTACISFGVGGRVVGGRALVARALGNWKILQIRPAADASRESIVRHLPHSRTVERLPEPRGHMPAVRLRQHHERLLVPYERTYGAVVGMTSCTQWPDGEGNASP